MFSEKTLLVDQFSLLSDLKGQALVHLLLLTSLCKIRMDLGLIPATVPKMVQLADDDAAGRVGLTPVSSVMKECVNRAATAWVWHQQKTLIVSLVFWRLYLHECTLKKHKKESVDALRREHGDEAHKETCVAIKTSPCQLNGRLSCHMVVLTLSLGN